MKKLYLFVILIIIVIVGTYILMNQGKDKNTSSENNTTQNESTQSATDNKKFTLEEIATHNSEDDCYLIIEDKVYNVTSFISSHPGGQAILQGCGTDATTLFETKPMGSNTPHSQSARNLLQSYYIGDLI
ncbi:hypothetical protein A2X44_04410 [candidate division CPR3 bacterium GWF2_35_18]|uniref:Cytochrome b5 n=1 Tax=candidate division CPR3 bacterium GW2011_GWF2_35_18 TaxID=1618350 RepID=A0A0G0EPX0_UNCC3|nr:MAG: Cytochrome b5 [candidate division CPR3 bacterium GW2011_GWF2_35_18]KKP85665.1 MAG: Cytochrome b5 [candidate division CPR3 bacterium GW2011_GWE2_35_7]OGB62596.1 MAG: hypothetical protein A2X44_04410 [candidate division CPR3 bacterium GWF2_35_18]OGB65847.1 MAG: hypothetical protein A2250_01660 [candidate division CPR3 bacterium RIFOXYA2_FULL_35_13]OGB76666.1 MAG: hypothetical protein A2476_03460 [candidate division CPR3 bacterium RIFOXYC2_FULL_35_7]OGB78823.1 MAG: hypothetical protein A2